MKKIIKTTAAGIFAIITVLSFAACGNNSSDDNSKAPSPVISEASASNTVYTAAKTARARTFNRTCTDSEPQFST